MDLKIINAMEKLTLEYALENKFNANDCVKYFKPNADDAYTSYIIWERTCFPFDYETMINQLNKLFLNEGTGSGG